MAERQDLDQCMSIMQMRMYDDLSRRAEKGQMQPEDWALLEELERDTGGITEHESESLRAQVGSLVANASVART